MVVSKGGVTRADALDMTEAELWEAIISCGTVQGGEWNYSTMSWVKKETS